MDLGLAGRIAIVNGSSQGIGYAIAHLLAEEGAHVVMSARRVEALEAAAARVREETGAEVLAVQADTRNPGDCERIVERCVAHFGGVDILVNNAGLTRDNILFRIKDEDWDAVLDANLRGAFVAIRAASRGMMKRRWGRIINIASVVGLVGNKGQANYAASKAGLIGLTKSVAKELASRNILANVVAPGFVETDMTAAMTDEAKKALFTQIPLERLGTPADIANIVAFLSSDVSSYITGQVFVVDGGMVM